MDKQPFLTAAMHNLTAEQKQRVDNDLIDILYKQSPMGIASTAILAVILTYLLRNLIPPPALMTWLCSGLLLSLIRTLLVYCYSRGSVSADRMGRWGFWNIALIAVSGLFWGAPSIFLFPYQSLSHQFLLALLLCGMVAGAAMAFAVVMRAFVSFSVLALLPLIVRMITQVSDIHLAVGIMAIVYWILSCLIALNIRKTRIQLLLLKEELADRVIRRTKALESANTQLQAEIQQRIEAQDRLHEERVRLEEARKIEAIATLAGGMAHQFNNSLSVIVGILDLMQQEYDHDARIKNYINPMAKTARHMSQLTDQLLAYAKGGKYKSQPADMTSLIQSTLSLTKHTFPPGVTVSTELGANLPRVQMDTTQMQMVISAILANACEAMDTGGQIHIDGSALKITAQESSQYGGILPGDYVEVIFSDTGVGMDSETLGRIFEPFFSTKFQGRGLAMAAVYGIIQNHKGHVGVTSQKGRGTQVKILLPTVLP